MDDAKGIFGDKEIIRGLLDRVTYTNEENGYSVFRIRPKDGLDIVTAVGYSARITPGEELELEGTWVEHPKFGFQFSFSSCRSILPSTVEGIKRYLGSGLVKGVGPVLAGKIVDEFGSETLDVLDREPEKLLEVKGISGRLLDSIKSSWEQQKEVRSVMLFLQSHDISPNFAAKIFAEYGQDSVQVVKENPYRLAADIFGVGFLSADRVAKSLGVEYDAPVRLDAGVQYALARLTNEGHVYAPRQLLAERAADLLGTEPSLTDEAINRAAADYALTIERIRPSGATEAADAVYLPIYYMAESKCASMTAELLSRERAGELFSDERPMDMELATRWVGDRLGIELAENQKRALEMALESRTCIITGGPGTGKTTLIRAIISIWEARSLRIMLAAPTGRAAKRMFETTGHEAKTIHRLLEYNGQGGAFARDGDNPLNCDLLIVDEASMIDILLMYNLMRALPRDCRLILVGDTHQLPSVGPGNVLGDLISSETIPVTRLTEIYRQAKESSIVVNAHRVNSGFLPEEPEKSGLKDFYIVEQKEPERCIDVILSLVTNRIPQRFGLDPIEDIQVLTPMHKGSLGSANLNAVLQRELNPGTGRGITKGARVYSVGDKVMQMKNDYERDVYNGDIGIITDLDPDEGMLSVCIDGREVLYESHDLDELVHAYAVSIHKSQGSEYPAVVIPIHTQHYMLLQRNLLYTGITRGKQLVVLVGTKQALALAVKNDNTKKRFTYLGERIRNITGIL